MTMESRLPGEQDGASDVFRSLSPEDADVWREILLRLAELQRSQAILADSIQELGGIVHDVLTGQTALGTGAAPARGLPPARDGGAPGVRPAPAPLGTGNPGGDQAPPAQAAGAPSRPAPPTPTPTPSPSAPPLRAVPAGGLQTSGAGTPPAPPRTSATPSAPAASTAPPAAAGTGAASVGTAKAQVGPSGPTTPWAGSSPGGSSPSGGTGSTGTDASSSPKAARVDESATGGAADRPSPPSTTAPARPTPVSLGALDRVVGDLSGNDLNEIIASEFGPFAVDPDDPARAGAAPAVATPVTAPGPIIGPGPITVPGERGVLASLLGPIESPRAEEDAAGPGRTSTVGGSTPSRLDSAGDALAAMLAGEVATPGSPTTDRVVPPPPSGAAPVPRIPPRPSMPDPATVRSVPDSPTARPAVPVATVGAPSAPGATVGSPSATGPAVGSQTSIPSAPSAASPPPPMTAPVGLQTSATAPTLASTPPAGPQPPSTLFPPAAPTLRPAAPAPSAVVSSTTNATRPPETAGSRPPGTDPPDAPAEISPVAPAARGDNASMATEILSAAPDEPAEPPEPPVVERPVSEDVTIVAKHRRRFRLR